MKVNFHLSIKKIHSIYKNHIVYKKNHFLYRVIFIRVPKMFISLCILRYLHVALFVIRTRFVVTYVCNFLINQTEE